MTAGKGTTIFVVDDDPSVRKGLRRLLKSAGYGVETFVSAEDFLDLDKSGNSPACLILDLKMPGMNGLDLQEELIAQNRIIPIIFVTGHGDIPSSVKAIKKGAVDFLSKPFDDEKLFDAVEEALIKDAEARAVSLEEEGIRKSLGTLTPREYEILKHVIAGLLNKQTAYVLKISEKTVKVHRARIMEKMGVDSVAQLVRLAEKVGVQPAEGSI
ncbi:MAG: response regulator transcription factor [Deltaproteobacteria bacterium]|nr:response regulator transcription factor [Deltaproteobacteria bacterium]